MPPAAASNATCSTVLSSAWSPSPWICAPPRQPHPWGRRARAATGAAGLDGVLDDLREIARGLHPAILADGGLRPALKTLARRSAVPDLDIQVDRRLPDTVEIAAYYTLPEALTNAAKHARATGATRGRRK
jgi:signal transduction histidine kinase